MNREHGAKKLTPPLPFSDGAGGPSPGRTRRWWRLAAGLLALLTVNLGNRGLNEPDEGRYANIAFEMLEKQHGWWEPRMSDLARYDKPPLIYWVTAGCYELFGVNEWSARLPCDSGRCEALAEAHFVDPLDFPAHVGSHRRGRSWAVRFKGSATSPLVAALRVGPLLESMKIGSFTLDRLAPGSPLLPCKRNLPDL